MDGEGKILGVGTASGGSGHWAQRFQNIVKELDEFLKLNGVQTVHEIVTELPPPSSHPGLKAVIGAILTLPQLAQVDLKKQNMISPSSWKAFARRKGCTDKDPKGIPALSAILETPPDCPTDDAADAVLIALTWFESQAS